MFDFTKYFLGNSEFYVFPNWACVWNSKANWLFWNQDSFKKTYNNVVGVVLIDTKDYFSKFIIYQKLVKDMFLEMIQNFLQMLSYFRTVYHLWFKATLFHIFWPFLLQIFNFTLVILALLTIFRLLPKNV